MNGAFSPNIVFEMILNMNHYFKNNNGHEYFRNVSGHSVRIQMAASLQMKWSKNIHVIDKFILFYYKDVRYYSCKYSTLLDSCLCRFVLMHLPGKITYKEIDEMIATVDKNEDWKISYSEFRVREYSTIYEAFFLWIYYIGFREG